MIHYLHRMPATMPAASTLMDRAVLRLSGDDPRGFLQGLVTNDVAGDLPVWTALLTAQGKVLFDFLVFAAGGDGGDDLLIDCEAAQAEALARRLTLYRLRRAITIARDEVLAVHWSPDMAGPGEADPRHRGLGNRWIAAPADPAQGWPAHRLALGICEGVAELGSDRTLWLEANAAELNGVSFTKGCYVGQENTARMNWRQKVNRRLVVVKADAAPDDALAHHPDLGLAIVRRRVETIADDPDVLKPDWLLTALAQG